MGEWGTDPGKLWQQVLLPNMRAKALHTFMHFFCTLSRCASFGEFAWISFLGLPAHPALHVSTRGHRTRSRCGSPTGTCSGRKGAT
jgi:hypothetical protein